jgi:hypothetical protein
MVIFTPMVLEFNDKIKIENMPKKVMVFCHKFAKRRCFIIVISCTCDKVLLYQFCYMKDYKFSILFIWDIYSQSM